MSKISETASRLYEAADKLRDVKGPSAVARLLGVSPQVMKNWELRDVSEGGALLAQLHIGCDANWLIGNQKEMMPSTKPMPAVYMVAERSPWGQPVWPFASITPEEWASLIPAVRKEMEQKIKDAIKVQSLTQQTTRSKA